jgi:ferric-dicitrate binding protein FerR (iron transport regulator)
MKTPALRELLERFFDRTARGSERAKVIALQATGEIDQVTADVLDDDFRDFENGQYLSWLLEEERMVTDVARKIKIGVIDPGQDEETVRKALDGIDNPDLLEIPQDELEKIKYRSFCHVLNRDSPEEVTKRPGRWQMAASISVVLLASLLYMLDAWNNAGYHEIVSVGKTSVQLPDGSSVILNANSKISYTDDFGREGQRDVILTGEAFFDVVHDAASPFVIHSCGTTTRVLGTAFSVKANPLDNKVYVTVARGLVQVGDEEGRVYDKVYPDQQVVVNLASGSYVTRNVDADLALLWKENILAFDSISLEKAAERISARFNVVIFFQNPVLKDCFVNGTFVNEGATWEYVLDALTKSLDGNGGIRYTIRPNGRIMLQGSGCGP